MSEHMASSKLYHSIPLPDEETEAQPSGWTPKPLLSGRQSHEEDLPASATDFGPDSGFWLTKEAGLSSHQQSMERSDHLARVTRP